MRLADSRRFSVAARAVLATLLFASSAEGVRLVQQDLFYLDHQALPTGLSGLSAHSGLAVVAASSYDLAARQPVGELVADDAVAATYPDSFFSSAIDGSLALLGGTYAIDDSLHVGTAVLFDVASGQQLLRFASGIGPAPLFGAFDWFGASVDLDEGRVLIGAFGDAVGSPVPAPSPGAAYLFSASTGQQLRKFEPGDGVTGAEFGRAVAIDDGLALIGAPQQKVGSDRPGTAYLYDAVTGNLLHTLVPDDPGDFGFGKSVALDNGYALIGKLGDDDHGAAAGAAYLFDVSTGEQLLKITPDDGAAFNYFGYKVAISGGIALISSYDWRPDVDEAERQPGAAYLFDVSNGRQLLKLTGQYGSQDEHFGDAVALSESHALVSGSYEVAGARPTARVNYTLVLEYETVPAPSAVALLALGSFAAAQARARLARRQLAATCAAVNRSGPGRQSH